jgi:hypothetical protein
VFPLHDGRCDVSALHRTPVHHTALEMVRANHIVWRDDAAVPGGFAKENGHRITEPTLFGGSVGVAALRADHCGRRRGAADQPGPYPFEPVVPHPHGRCPLMRNASIAAGVGAVLGLSFWAAFRFAAGVVTRLIAYVYRARQAWRERKH